jgi:hypothetical protein
MTNKTGILDRAKNPFWCKSWEDQGYGLTEGRRENLPSLFGNDEDSIRKKFSRNDGAYVAFIAIRWGFAKMSGEKLTATDKWLKYGLDKSVLF